VKFLKHFNGGASYKILGASITVLVILMLGVRWRFRGRFVDVD
jgi:hypothetical protein